MFNNPYRATKAEDAIKGKTIDEANAEAAGAAAVSGVMALPAVGLNPGNKFKVQVAKTLVKRAILACAQSPCLFYSSARRHIVTVPILGNWAV